MSEEGLGQRPRIVLLVLVIFFVMSLFTNTIAPLIPEIISSFRLSLAAAGVLPFMLFVAYGLASIPAGIWIERTSEKRVVVGAFALALVAALSFAILPRYVVAIASLFATGVAMAALQVAINPILRVAGGAQSFAFYSTLAQLVFGAGSFLSPRLYALVVTRTATSSWVSLYWIYAGLAGVMIFVAMIARIPRVERLDDEKTGTIAVHRELLLGKSSTVPRYFVSIFMYVGSEQGVASWLSQFLSTYHRVDPRTGGAGAVSWFWGLMTLGCLVGLGLLKVVADSRKVLVGAASFAILLLAIGLFTSNAHVAIIALPAIGFFASVMWPIVFALALNSVPAHHGTVSGILCTGIIGGAIVPLIIGKLGDLFGLRASMTICFFTLAWVLSVGLWSKRPSPSPNPSASAQESD
jgi:MFS transporter, FHS family, L-fucose permease